MAVQPLEGSEGKHGYQPPDDGPRGHGQGGVAGEHAATDERVGSVGEAGEHKQDVSAPVRGKCHARTGKAIEDYEHCTYEGEGGAHQLASGEPLPEKHRGEQDERDGLDGDEQCGVGSRRARHAPVGEAEGGGEAEHPHPEDIPAVGARQATVGSVLEEGEGDDDHGAESEPGHREGGRTHVVEDGAGGYIARSVDGVGDEQNEVCGGHPAEYRLQSRAWIPRSPGFPPS